MMIRLAILGAACWSSIAVAEPATKDDLQAAYCLAVFQAEAAKLTQIRPQAGKSGFGDALEELTASNAERMRRTTMYLVIRGYGQGQLDGLGIAAAASQGRSDYGRCGPNRAQPPCPIVMRCFAEEHLPF